MTNLLLRRRSPWRLSLVATLIANKIRFHLFSFCKWMFSSNLFFLSGTPWSWVIIVYLHRWPPTPPPWLAHESKLHQLQSLVEPCKVNGHVTTRVGQMKSNIASDLADNSGGECNDECPGEMWTYQESCQIRTYINRKLDQNQRDVDQLASAIKGCWSHAPTKRGGYLIPHSKSYSASD